MIGRNAVATVGEAGTTYAPGKEDSYLRIPPGSTNITIGQDGVGQLHRQQHRVENLPAACHRRLHLARDIRQRIGPRTARRLAVGATANSGTPIVGTPDTPGFGSTIGGVLELSNVDLATEMTNMITAERGYQANSRVISTAAEMLGTVVTLRPSRPS